jgi:hypothetical protein
MSTTADVCLSLVKHDAIRAGEPSPFVEGTNLYHHRGMKTFVTQETTSSVIVFSDPVESIRSGIGSVYAVELGADGTAVDVATHKIEITPELHNLYTSVGVLGATFTVANTSGRDDKSGSMTAGLLRGYESDIKDISSTDIIEKSRGETFTQRDTGDGVAVIIPYGVGEAMARVPKPAPATAPGLSSASSHISTETTRFASITNSSADGVQAGWTTASTVLDIDDNFVTLWDSNDVTASTYDKFVFPVSCQNISLRGYIGLVDNPDAAAGFFSSIYVIARVYDKNGKMMKSQSVPADRLPRNVGSVLPDSVKDGTILWGFQGGPNDKIGADGIEIHEFSFNADYLQFPRPIGGVDIVVGNGGGSGTTDFATGILDLGLHTRTEDIAAPPVGVVLIEGLTPQSSITVAGGVVLNSMVRSDQSRLVDSAPHDFDVVQVSGAVRQAAHELCLQPVVSGSEFATMRSARVAADLPERSASFKSFGKSFVRSLHKADKTFHKAIAPAKRMIKPALPALKSVARYLPGSKLRQSTRLILDALDGRRIRPKDIMNLAVGPELTSALQAIANGEMSHDDAMAVIDELADASDFQDARSN